MEGRQTMPRRLTNYHFSPAQAVKNEELNLEYVVRKAKADITNRNREAAVKDVKAEMYREVWDKREKQDLARQRSWKDARNRGRQLWQKVLDEADAREEEELRYEMEQQKLARLAHSRSSASYRNELVKVHKLKDQRRLLALEVSERKFQEKLTRVAKSQSKVQDAERKRQELLTRRQEELREEAEARRRIHERNASRAQRKRDRKERLIQHNIELYNKKVAQDARFKKQMKEELQEQSAVRREQEKRLRQVFKKAEEDRYRKIMETLPQGQRPRSAPPKSSRRGGSSASRSFTRSATSMSRSGTAAPRTAPRTARRGPSSFAGDSSFGGQSFASPAGAYAYEDDEIY